MSRRITATVEIGATPHEVWSVLTDLAGYKEWNPYISRADGRVEQGARLSLGMNVGGKTFTVKPTVVEVTHARCLRWVGRLGFPGLFDAEHVHHLQPIPGGTRYIQSERFSGIAVPFVGKTLSATADAFEAMNGALKDLADAGKTDVTRRK